MVGIAITTAAWAAPLPDTLPRSEIRATLARVDTRACVKDHPAFAATEIELTIGADGVPRSVNVPELPDHKTQLCLTNVLSAARFAQARGVTKLTLPLRFPRPDCDARGYEKRAADAMAAGDPKLAAIQYDLATTCTWDPRLEKLAVEAACRAHDAGGADRHFQELPEDQRQAVIAACAREGIRLVVR